MDASTSPPADSVPHHLYRFVGLDGEPPIADTDFRYSLPTRNADDTYTPGAWTPAVTDLIPCERGYHAVRVQDLPCWINQASRATLYRAEVRGRVLPHEDASTGPKLVCEQLRLLYPIETLTVDVLRAWALDCAEHVLPIYEQRCPGDDRPRRCVEVTRRYLAGEATRAELNAARRSAYAAACAATADAYADAAAAAAYAAACAATADAYAADAAAAYAGAYAYARHQERLWQAQRLAELLGLPWDGPEVVS